MATPATTLGFRDVLALPPLRRLWLAQLVSVFGANRIAWGSNYPASPGTMSEIVASSKEALRAVSDTDRSFIFAKTAQQLYPVLQD